MKRKGIFAAYGAALALLALASVYDLFLSERLYAPNCLFAWVLEHYASVVAYGCYAAVGDKHFSFPEAAMRF